MGESGKSAGSGIAGLGVVLVVVGIICYFYPETQGTYWGLSSTTVYPYRDIGTLLLLFGIIVAVVGGVVYGLSGNDSSTSTSPVILYQPQAQTFPVQQSTNTQQTTGKKYCSSCGRTVPSDSVLCPYCGATIGRP